MHRPFSTFISPMSANNYNIGYYDYNRELQIQVQIGSKMFPEYHVRSLA